MAINPFNPITILLNREIALRQKVEPSRAVPLALTGSVLGGMTQSPWVGPILTRHLAQREAIPEPAPPAKPRDDIRDDAMIGGAAAARESVAVLLAEAGQLQSVGGEPEHDLKHVGDALLREVAAARARSEQAQEAARAAAEANREAGKAFAETAERARNDFLTRAAEIEVAFDSKKRSFSEAMAELKDSFGHLLDGVAAANDTAKGHGARGARGAAHVGASNRLKRGNPARPSEELLKPAD
ncbi:MAG TPA: hypothetical protein VFT13_01740 [Candidatus Krumholzibacteria bacterium]|nr:hypothetical protein [Candidatus Krumholzibacteria bacterium]